MEKYYGRQDRAKAVEILVKDLKVFAAFNEELFKEITQLLTLDNFRYEECLSLDFMNFCLVYKYFFSWPIMCIFMNLQT